MVEPLSKLEELTLVLLHWSAFQERGELRSWKGYDWGVMNQLHAKGLITDPVGKAKSVFLTDEGRRQGEVLVRANLELGASGPSPRESICGCGCGTAKTGGGFLPGHDQKLRTELEKRVGGLLALRDLVEAVEAYTHGRATAEEVTRELRALLGGRD